MSTKLLGTVALAFSLAMSTTAFAGSWGCGEGLQKMVGSLKIDSAQKEKIKPVLETLKSSIKDNADQMKDLDKQLKEQADSATMDQSAVDSLIDKKSKLIGAMMKAKIVAKNQILAILTPEQKTQLQNMMKKAEEKMMEKFKSCHDQE